MRKHINKLPIELIDIIKGYLPKPIHPLATIIKKELENHTIQQKRYNMKISFIEFRMQCYLIRRINRYFIETIKANKPFTFHTLDHFKIIQNHNNETRKQLIISGAYYDYNVGY